MSNNNTSVEKNGTSTTELVHLVRSPEFSSMPDLVVQRTSEAGDTPVIKVPSAITEVIFQVINDLLKNQPEASTNRCIAGSPLHRGSPRINLAVLQSAASAVSEQSRVSTHRALCSSTTNPSIMATEQFAEPTEIAVDSYTSSIVNNKKQNREGGRTYNYNISLSTDTCR